MKMTRDKLEQMLEEYDRKHEAQDLPTMGSTDLEAIQQIAGDSYSLTAYAAFRLGVISMLRQQARTK